jgi:hypothetical protein
MNKMTILAIVAIVAGSTASAGDSTAGGEPKMNCGDPHSSNWDSCVGMATYPNGNIYRGEFHHGMREGFGFIIINAKGTSDRNNILSDEPAIYAGEFRENALNGRGIWFPKTGPAYSGRFIDNLPQTGVSHENCSGPPTSWSKCVGTVTYGNGNVYRGEFLNGQREGIGMLEIRFLGTSDATGIRTPIPGIYVGEFRGDRLNGRGMIFMPGAGFYGTFVDNVLSGQLPTT